MSMIRRAVAAAFCLALSAGIASAETTVKWLHIEVNPNQVKLWEEVARGMWDHKPQFPVKPPNYVTPALAGFVRSMLALSSSR